MPPVKQHYVNAPISEAVIDLRVKVPADVNLQTLESICDAEKEKYPERRHLREATAELKFSSKSELATTASQIQTGIMCISKPRNEIFQAKLNGFTFSRLSPYESWDLFEAECRRLWNVYREMTQPEAVTRIAVRYVNRIDIPLPFSDFKEFLRTVPDVSSDLPQGLAGFFMQLHIPMDDIGSMLLLNEAIIPPFREGVISVALDIDLFREHSIPLPEDELWNLFSVLHDRKNEIFEGCITDKTRELFK